MTSLDPIRPQNKPTPREKRALKAFENGADEVGRTLEQDGETIFYAGRRLNNVYVTIRKQATLDEVTGVSNRKSFSERIKAELNRSWRDQEPLSLIICDIDHSSRIMTITVMRKGINA